MTTSMDLSFYGKGSEAQLTNIPAGDKEFVGGLNGLISLIAPASLTHLSDVDPKKIGKAAVARKFMRDIMEKREQTGDFGWTLCVYPPRSGRVRRFVHGRIQSSGHQGLLSRQ